VRCNSSSGGPGESELKHKRLFTFGLILFISGVVLLFQPKVAWLRGVSFPCLLVAVLMLTSALDRAQPLGWRVIEILSGIGLLVGLACLLISDLRRYSMQILATSALAFGISTIYLRATAILGGLISAVGLFLLLPLPLLIFQESPLDRGNPLRPFALPLILTGVLLFSLSSSRKVLVERLALGGIFSGLFFLCQPFWEGFYQVGFQILLSGLVGFITISHR